MSMSFLLRYICLNLIFILLISDSMFGGLVNVHLPPETTSLPILMKFLKFLDYSVTNKQYHFTGYKND